MSGRETSVAQIADWDDAYANIAHIPGGAGFPDAWAAAAADFRAGRHGTGASPRAPGIFSDRRKSIAMPSSTCPPASRAG